MKLMPWCNATKRIKIRAIKVAKNHERRILELLWVTFAIPYAFEDLFGHQYNVPEKYFYAMLRKRADELSSMDGWFFCADAAISMAGKGDRGFASCGLSPRTCKSARKKLKADGLVETRYVHGRKGYRIGTEYRLIDDGFAKHPKAIHRSIMGGSVWKNETVLHEFHGISPAFALFSQSSGVIHLLINAFHGFVLL